MFDVLVTVGGTKVIRALPPDRDGEPLTSPAAQAMKKRAGPLPIHQVLRSPGFRWLAQEPEKNNVMKNQKS